MSKNTKLYETYLAAGDLYVRRDRHEEAIDFYKLALATDVNNAVVLSRLGNRYLTIGERQKAIECHNRVLKMRGWENVKGYTFSRNYFCYEERIELWNNVLKEFVDKEVSYLEIGSREGMSLCWMLENILTHPNSKATSVDIKHDELFDHNIKVSGGSTKVTKLEMSSELINRYLEGHFFDIVYVDGSHYADDTFIDCVNSLNKMVSGGVMIIDDYVYYNVKQHAGRADITPQAGIDKFLYIYREDIELLHKGMQIIIKKK